MSGPRLLLGVAATAVLVLAATAARAEETSPAAPTAAAWYPSGVGTLTAPTYPAGTLHVGAVLGQETDRTYLRFSLPGIPDDASVDRVQVAIPVDPEAGTSSPEIATILACTVPGGFDPDATEPATVDCDGAPEATFAGDTFTVELSVAGDEVDIALVPNGGESWHVGFRDASAVVTFSAPTPAATTTTIVPRPVSPAPSAAPTPGGPIALPPLTVAPPSAAGQAIADQAVLPPPVAASESSGFRYAAVFALPLAMLIVVGIVGDGLTRPVRLREETT